MTGGAAGVALDWAQRLAKSRPDLDNFLSCWPNSGIGTYCSVIFRPPPALLAHQDLQSDLNRAAAVGPA